MVDVRTPDEFALGALKGAVNIPLDDMRERMKEIPQDKPVYLYCGVGLRGYLASNILLQNGFGEVRNLIGGLKLYKAATAPLPKPKEFSIPDLQVLILQKLIILNTVKILLKLILLPLPSFLL